MDGNTMDAADVSYHEESGPDEIGPYFCPGKWEGRHIVHLACPLSPLPPSLTDFDCVDVDEDEDGEEDEDAAVKGRSSRRVLTLTRFLR